MNNYDNRKKKLLFFLDSWINKQAESVQLVVNKKTIILKKGDITYFFSYFEKYGWQLFVEVNSINELSVFDEKTYEELSEIANKYNQYFKFDKKPEIDIFLSKAKAE